MLHFPGAGVGLKRRRSTTDGDVVGTVGGKDRVDMPAQAKQLPTLSTCTMCLGGLRST